mmetsp:Transcript_115064/g.365585  ORF Transcript_115064/g.365585 Transcript_115064/m.365585 type:complete len:122 (-) Transcript_115064:119-484(-)
MWVASVASEQLVGGRVYGRPSVTKETAIDNALILAQEKRSFAEQFEKLWRSIWKGVWRTKPQIGRSCKRLPGSLAISYCRRSKAMRSVENQLPRRNWRPCLPFRSSSQARISCFGGASCSM